jgi:hypothetical protein
MPDDDRHGSPAGEPHRIEILVIAVVHQPGLPPFYGHGIQAPPAPGTGSGDQSGLPLLTFSGHTPAWEMPVSAAKKAITGRLILLVKFSKLLRIG